MHEAVWPVLAPWSNFYIMAGSSAAALTGLMFVVITLVSASGRGSSRDGVSTFSTPTVVHFCAALLASAILVAPWPSPLGPAWAIGLAALTGIAYSFRVIYRTSKITEYNADIEDWSWYAILPLIAYVALLASAIALSPFGSKALFIIAAAVVLLIFLGIHNAWDTVTYLAIKREDEPPTSN